MPRWLILLFALWSSVCAAEIPVTGRVLDQKRRPVPGAQVTLFPIPNPIQRSQVELHSGGAPVPTARVVADAAGAYRLPAPGPGLWILRVDAPGYVPAETLLSPSLSEYDAGDALLDADASLRVLVMDARQKPVAGALVRIEDQDQRDFYIGKSWKRAVRTAVTGENGAAVLAKAAEETLILSITAEGFHFVERKQVHTGSLTVALSGGYALTLRVTDQHGKSVQGALLALGDSGHAAEFTNEQGLAYVRIPRGTCVPAYLYARDGRSYRWMLTAASDRQEPMEIRLPEVCELTGRVVDAETGQPLNGAMVWSGSERWNQSVAVGGSYTLRLPAGNTIVRCAADGYADKLIYDFALAPGKNHMTFALNPAAVLEGVVVTPQQVPVPEADLKLDRGLLRMGAAIYWPQFQRKLRTRKDGTFRIPGLDTQYVYKLTAQAGGFAPASTEFNVSGAMRIRKGIRLELKTGQTATGTVVDTSDRPVPGAGIVVYSSLVEKSNAYTAFMPPEELQRSTAGDDGVFMLAGLAAGKVDLEVSARGYATQKLSGVEILYKKEPQNLAHIVLKPGVALTGRVLNPGKQPLEGAQVRVQPASPMGDMDFMEAGEPAAVTSADGWFRIEDQGEGSQVDISIHREGYLDLELPAAAVSGTEPLVLTLQPSSRVSGKILNDAGKPVANAQATLLKISRGMSFTRRTATSDGEGFFEIKDVSPGTYSLAVMAPGWQDNTMEGIVVAEGKDIDGLKLVLAPEALLEGAVTAPDGMPAAGAIVEMMVPGERMNRRQRSRASSDGEGAYQLHGLKPGAVSIQVTHERYPRLVKDVDLQAGANHIDFQLAGGSNISGRAIDEAGAPVQGVAISVYLLPSIARAYSESDGSFVLKGIPDGDHTLRIEKEGMTPENRDLTVHVAGAPVEGITIVLREGAVLSGNVLGLDAEKLPQVAIEAYDTEGGYKTTRVDSNGSYRIPGLGPGHWYLNATLPGGSPQTSRDVVVEAGMKEARLDLKFGEGIRLTGVVLRGGEPQPALDVSISGKDVDSYASCSTSAAGRFYADGLQRGLHAITVSSGTAPLRYSEDIDLQRDQDIVLRIPESHIRGKVTDAADGSPIAGAALALLRPQEADRYPVAVTATATDGTFEFANVAAGDWNITANKDGYAAFTQAVQIQGEQNMDNLNVALQPTEGLVLDVHLAGGGVPARVVYAALDGAGNTVTAGDTATAEGGRIRIRSLPHGTWELLLLSLNTAVTTVTVSAPQPSVVPVTLLPACSLHVRVPELATEKVIGKAVLTNAEGKVYRVPRAYSPAADAEQEFYSGEFTIASLPPDTWTVQARTPDGRTWSGTASTNPAATAELVLQ